MEKQSRAKNQRRDKLKQPNQDNQNGTKNKIKLKLEEKNIKNNSQHNDQDSNKAQNIKNIKKTNISTQKQKMTQNSLKLKDENDNNAILKSNRMVVNSKLIDNAYYNIKSIADQDIGSSADSEDEEILIKTGRVPRHWYDDYKHLGYDASASKVEKQVQQDKIEQFLEKADNKDWWRTVRDELNNQDVVLTDKQLDVIHRIVNRKYASSVIENTDYIRDFEYKDGIYPMTNAPKAKQSFLASKFERIKVNKLVQAIKLGRISFDEHGKRLYNTNKQEQEQNIVDLWGEGYKDDEGNLNEMGRKMPPSISAPKTKLPGHSESYNPSDEFLFDEQEKEQYLQQDAQDRSVDFIPKKHERLRQVKGYENFIQERFERCLDLYLCPRLRKKKLAIDPATLIPKLPKPSELRPFPSMRNVEYKGHTSRVRAIALSPKGQYLASCDEKGVMNIWDVATSRVVYTTSIMPEGVSYALDWNHHGLLAMSNEENIFIYNPSCLRAETRLQNEAILLESCSQHQNQLNNQNQEKQSNQNDSFVVWKYIQANEVEFQRDLRLTLKLQSAPKKLQFQAKGDYLLSVQPTCGKKNEQLIIHCISKGSSQRPISKCKGNLENACFHPTKPFIFLVTKKNTYIYNLQTSVLLKKLVSGAQWNTTIAVHPKGDNALVGSLDKRVCWFDLDLQNTPFKTMRYHNKAVRQVRFHQKYPLFATSSDDFPLKVLKGHVANNDLGVLDIIFHPVQPWIFSAGADHNIYLWT